MTEKTVLLLIGAVGWINVIQAAGVVGCMEMGFSARTCAVCVNLLTIAFSYAAASLVTMTSGALDKGGYFDETMRMIDEDCVKRTSS